MESSNKIKAFLDLQSFRDLTITISCIYLGEITAATEPLSRAPSWVSGLLPKVIVIAMVTSIVDLLLLPPVSDRDMDKPLDERES
ncbi:hypothetical protein [Pseudoalteromonas peptidolytica]|uniref:hypothetical protein n=1 Tax=Pseudoalteromonas peptidolytica TaxID=61150 RepID=UPI001170094F|nr:hypothetical protein [Pseudoalteromonas peptidolytica]GEK08447.1 hypothetical protein PPE03_06960 [Pseudoalteromonas peptidolytica]